MKRIISIALVIATLLGCFALPASAATVSSDNIHDILFDWEYYYNSYSDIRNAFGRNQTALRRHWDQYGKREGRRPSILYDPAYYRDAHSDLKASFESDYTALYNHLVSYGIREGRATSSAFNVSTYKNNYLDLRNAFGTGSSDFWEYFKHYRNYGQKEGRTANRSIAAAPTPAPSAPKYKTVTPPQGKVYIVPEASSGFAISTRDGCTTCTPIHLWTLISGNNDQIYRFEKVSGEWYKIVHVASGKVLNVKNGIYRNGTGLWLHPYDGTDACLFRLLDAGNGYYHIENKRGFLIDLDSARTHNGSIIHLWNSYGSRTSRWKMISAEQTASETAYVNTTSLSLNVRSAPSSSASVIGKLPRGAKVTVLGTSGSWKKIKTSSLTGYVSAQYLSSQKPSTTQPTVITPSYNGLHSPVPANAKFNAKTKDYDYKEWYHDINRYYGKSMSQYYASTDIPVYAIANGTAYFYQYVGSNGLLRSYGNYVVFKSADGVWEVRYAHLDRFNGVATPVKTSASFPCSSGVTAEAKKPIAALNVSAGQVLGYIGSTGNSQAKHLHIEIYQNGKRVDPTEYFPDLKP